MASKTHKRELRRMKKMEAVKAKRELKDIQVEYTQLCQQSGEMQYKILCFQDQLQQMNVRIRELKQEANSLQKESNGTEGSTEGSTQSGESGSKDIAGGADADAVPGSETSIPASVS
jgi:predicted  nucleic acid-binding Zn-ribbon protein